MSVSGWTSASLADVLAYDAKDRLLVQGWSPQCEREPADGFEEWAVLKTTAIQDGQFLPAENKKLPPDLAPRPELSVRLGDLLITSAGPRRRCGVPCLVEEDQPKRIISGKMYRFRADKRIVETKYLLAALRSQKIQTNIDAAKTGINDSGLNLTHDRFLRLELPLAPSAEQRRIVEKIDRLSARSKRARDELERVPKLVAHFKEQVLEQAFAGDLTARWRSERGIGAWETTTLEALISSGPSNGWSPKSGDDATGAWTLKLTATTSGKLRLDGQAVKRIYEKPGTDSKYWVDPGDILIQRANAIEHVGVAAIFDGPPKSYIFPDLMMRIRTLDPDATSFLWLYINSPSAKDYLRSRATGTAGNMPKINGGTVRSLPVPSLCAAERGELVRHIERTFAAIDRLAAEAKSGRALLDRLDQAILAKAFRGELVPQDPQDEPASVLLARIRAERGAGPTPKRSRPRAAAGG